MRYHYPRFRISARRRSCVELSLNLVTDILKFLRLGLLSVLSILVHFE
jgi:hypothetical protein